MINEDIRSRREFMTMLKEKRSVTEDENILYSDQG